jgi:prevent-host-death family protein
MTELRTQTERVVERVVAGETIDITRWGKSVATIKPVSPSDEWIRERIEAMRVQLTNKSDSSDSEATRDRTQADRS